MAKYTIGVAAVLAAAGCTGEPVPEFGGGSLSPACARTCEPDLVGAYQVDSRFELASPLPGKLGLVGTFIDVADDPNDPATWLLDRVDAHLPDRYRAALDFSRRTFALDEQVNKLLLDHAPGLLRRALQIGDQLGQVVDTLGLRSRLTVAADPIEPSRGAGRHQLTGATFWVDGQRYEFSSEELHWQGIGAGIVADAVPLVSRPEGSLDIDRHELSLPYGDLLMFAAQNVILPLHAGNTFDDLLSSWVDCERLGEFLTEKLGQGDIVDYTVACQAGVGTGLDSLDDILRGFVDVPAALTIVGSTSPVDSDCDCQVDQFDQGSWSGELTFDDGRVDLPAPDQEFSAVRVK